MTARTAAARLALALTVFAAVLAVSPLTAFAAARGPVVNDARVAGVSLRGMTEAEARGTIASLVKVPRLAPVAVNVVGYRRRALQPAGYVSVDVNAMLNAAYAATTAVSYDIAPAYAVDMAKVRTWVSANVGRYEVQPVDARREVRKKRLYIVPSVDGKLADKGLAVVRIAGALRANAESGAAQPGVIVEIVAAPARVTEATIGDTILVSLGERRVFFYKGTVLTRVYRCAIGQSAYPTPQGTFKIVDKSPAPAWRNPGSSWAKNMPAYIAPGPRNPLGLRALYLNSPGIRIHGTNKLSSIGSPASHGCIRLANSDIVKFYPLVSIGTPVIIFK